MTLEVESEEVAKISESTLLKFFIEVLQTYPITFLPIFGDPLRDTIDYISENTEIEYFTSKRNLVWDYLEQSGMYRDFESKEALSARLALSMMPGSPATELADKLYWFIVFCEGYGQPRDGLRAILRRYFSVGFLGDFATL